MELKKSIAEQRGYKVLNTEQAKEIVKEYLKKEIKNSELIIFGLPEIIDRYNIWKVPLVYNNKVIGDIAIDAYNSNINTSLSSDKEILIERMKEIDLDNYQDNVLKSNEKNKRKKFIYKVSNLNNTIIRGRSELALQKLPDESIDMIFTSPPYYNARKEYSEYKTYEDYLDLMRRIIKECRRVLIDGKYFVINSSHVLVPRASRSESSSRIAVPFDLHQIFMEEGFEFIDDIIWQKPEGAGWASGRGRRFSADRNPMQYKAVPVTEYVMVYRKKPCILIDNFIRKHPDSNIVKESKIEDDYEKTNIWYISPARDKRHPAIFPKELAEKVIKYYSFKNDVVLDPFGGIGTTAKVAISLDRRFCSIEANEEYINHTLNDLNKIVYKLFNNLDFEYIDYSNLEDNNNTKKSLRHVINDLINQGIEEERIIDILSKYIK